jgi:hypothetical protein|tara:strand:+ start:95 stop:271 length:177 start_codon:yes stop_codon:yes gene_type:complete
MGGTGEIIEFFPKWLENQEKRRRAMGFSTDLWYVMHELGYDPTKPENIEEFMRDLEDE